jgi:hypothetical protein
MNKQFFNHAAVVVVILIGFWTADVKSQIGMLNVLPVFSHWNLSGPRLGITYVSKIKELGNELKNRKIGNFIGQFGCHFEYQVSPSI